MVLDGAENTPNVSVEPGNIGGNILTGVVAVVNVVAEVVDVGCRHNGVFYHLQLLRGDAGSVPGLRDVRVRV